MKQDTTGTIQHFLPASYIGGFSSKARGKHRDRPVWVRRRGSNHIYMERAGNLSCARGYYDFKKSTADRNLVDQAITGYESRLPEAINALKRTCEIQDISARLWLTTLVPFVASLFTRNRDFSQRFAWRLKSMGGDSEMFSDSDNVNLARLMETQRLYAPVMQADWCVFSSYSEKPLITNDLGWAWAQFSPRVKELWERLR